MVCFSNMHIWKAIHLLALKLGVFQELSQNYDLENMYFQWRMENARRGDELCMILFRSSEQVSKGKRLQKLLEGQERRNKRSENKIRQKRTSPQRDNRSEEAY